MGRASAMVWFRCAGVKVGAAVAGLLAAAAVSPPPTKDARSGRRDDLDVQVSRWIEQLGAPEYAVREKAQAALERMGLEAFDALHEAQSHDDVEIASRARFLVQSMQVVWSRDSDPPEVKRILRRYGDQRGDGRKLRLQRLASLDNGAGVEALCRLARFEADDVLSKYAALLVMNGGAPAEDVGRSRRAELILENTGRSKRPAAQWLRALARTLREPQSALDEWERLAQLEHQTLAQFPEKSNREVVRDLSRWQAELLLGLKRNEQATAVIRRTFGLLDGSAEQLLDAVDWLIRVEAWSVVDELAGRFSDQFAQNVVLLYRMAEAQAKQGRGQLADQTAARALKLLPDKPSPHLEAADGLQTRGLFEWSEREHRHVMELGPRGSETDLMARFKLSEMLHDLGQPLRAAEALRPAVEAIDSDANALATLESRFFRSPGGVRSRMHYFYALHYASGGDSQKQREHLEKGLASDPRDADLLIVMHRAAGADAAWRGRVSTHIEAAAAFFRERMRQLQQLADRPSSEAQRAEANLWLASANNQLAWLLSNTGGDAEEALRCSRKSLELAPDNAFYLDTLARCYYANSDYVNAVKHQSRAAELEPHHEQIRRQLELFQKALAESQQREKSPSR